MLHVHRQLLTMVRRSAVRVHPNQQLSLGFRGLRSRRVRTVSALALQDERSPRPLYGRILTGSYMCLEEERYSCQKSE